MKTMHAAIGAGVATLIVIAMVWFFNDIEPPSVGEVDAYTDLQQAAITNVDALIERGLVISFGLVSLFGAAILGLDDKLKLSRLGGIAVSLALYFCVVSAVAGVTAKLKLAEMQANLLSPYTTSPIIGTPLAFQLYGLIAALGAIAFLVATKVFAKEGA